MPTSAKSFSQKEGEGEEQNLPRNDDEWRKLCEDAREVCGKLRLERTEFRAVQFPSLIFLPSFLGIDECKDMALECLKVENCRREGEDQAQEDHLPSQACAGVQVNDSAVNSFCGTYVLHSQFHRQLVAHSRCHFLFVPLVDYCGQNAETCQNLTTCEDSGGERGLLDRVNSMVNQVSKSISKQKNALALKCLFKKTGKDFMIFVTVFKL